jgi:hypothetical protein
MVKKIKVVDVAPVDATEAPEVVEETPQIEDVRPVEEAKEEVIEEKPVVEEIKEIEIVKNSKPLEYITCEHCNKNVLMKTYKYSHKKVCKAGDVPPPPPPPPTPEPEPKKEKAKRVAKPKEKKEQQADTPKPEFDGLVSFDHLKPPVDPYIAMRQERILIRQQRVKSLISQAI